MKIFEYTILKIFESTMLKIYKQTWWNLLCNIYVKYGAVNKPFTLFEAIWDPLALSSPSEGIEFSEQPLCLNKHK